MTTARSVLSGRILVGVAIFGIWEAYGQFVDPTWTSAPSSIVARLFEMGFVGVATNVVTTLYEMFLGLVIGLPCGLIVGLALGRMPRVAALLQPFLIAGNSIPLPALAPLFILWFGLGIAPKVVLVALVSFFLIFFTTLAGARSVDRDLIEMLSLMGASKLEVFRKIIAPASLVWIFAGLKNAVPYALIAATVGEILLSRSGVGFLISNAAQNFDMTGLYTALFILICLGAVLHELLIRLQGYMLRWRG
jgi:NitT/TauT family transport system permease protein